MVRKSFKEVMKDDVNNTFMNVDEFADMHTVDGKEIPVLDLGFVQVVDRVDQVARRFPVYAVVRGVDARVFPSGSVRRQAVPIAVRPQRVGRFRHPVSIPVPSSGNVYHRRMVRLSVSFRRFDVQLTLVVRFESEIPIYVVDGDQ